MPFYIFKNPHTNEVKEVLMSMNDEHKFIDSDGLEWERVFTIPQASIDTKVDPFNKVKFLEKTSKAGSIGDLWDRSKELSEKRAEKRDGVDEVKQKFFDKYKKERNGRMHPAERAEKNKGEIVI